MAFADVPIVNLTLVCHGCGLTPEQVIASSLQEELMRLDDGTFFGTPGGEFFCNRCWDRRQSGRVDVKGKK